MNILLAREQFSSLCPKFLDKRIPNSLLWKLNSCDSPNCSLHLDAKKIPDSWNIRRRHFPFCQVCRWRSFALGNGVYSLPGDIQSNFRDWSEKRLFSWERAVRFQGLWEINFLLMSWKTVHMALRSWVILKLGRALLKSSPGKGQSAGEKREGGGQRKKRKKKRIKKFLRVPGGSVV